MRRHSKGTLYRTRLHPSYVANLSQGGAALDLLEFSAIQLLGATVKKGDETIHNPP